MRRRRRASVGEEEEWPSWRRPQGGDSAAPAHNLEERLTTLREGGAAAGTAAAAFFSSLGKAIGESGSALVQTIKKVASQPALASHPAGSGGSRGGLGDTAEGVLSSLRQGLLPRGNLGRAQPHSHSGQAAPGSCHAMAPLPSRSKEDAKSD